MITDPIEAQLADLAERLGVAWRESHCVTGPLGECAALAASVLEFYRQTRGRE